MTKDRAGGWPFLMAMLLMAAPAGLLLSACKPTGNVTGEALEDGAPLDQSEKLDSYYRLTTTFDLAQLRQDYLELNAGKAKAGDDLFINDSGLQLGLEELQRARATEGAVREVDAAADRLVQTLQPLTERAKGLDSYFTMRGYQTDDYARARREDAPMLAAYDAAIAAYAPFVAAVEGVKARQEAALLRRLKPEDGAFHDILIGQKVRTIRAETASFVQTGKPETLARVDRLMAELDPLLVRGRAVWAAELAKRPVDERSMSESGVIAAAEQMIGAYRKFRGSGDRHDYERFRDEAAGVLQSGASI